MTGLGNKSRNWTLFLIMAAALFIVAQVLSLGSAIQNPTFLIMSQAKSDGARWLIKARLTVAGFFGGRTDVRMMGYGDKTSLEMASEEGKSVFLKEAAEFSSLEHIREVFDLACAEGRTAAIQAFREKIPELECRSEHVLGQSAQASKVWDIASLDDIGGHKPEILGEPRVVTDNGRTSVCFDGVDDAFFIPLNPIAGWNQFTVEVLFKPAADGPAEQRFLHIQDVAERRVLIETRVSSRGWALDTFLRATDDDKLTLLDPAKTSPADAWYWVALVYDGRTMSHYVNADKHLEGQVRFPPMAAGRMSLGVRQNKIHWFKGCIAQVRFTPEALPARLLHSTTR
jgi:hypothetical protein